MLPYRGFIHSQFLFLNLVSCVSPTVGWCCVLATALFASCAVCWVTWAQGMSAGAPGPWHHQRSVREGTVAQKEQKLRRCLLSRATSSEQTSTRAPLRYRLRRPRTMRPRWTPRVYASCLVPALHRPHRRLRVRHGRVGLAIIGGVSRRLYCALVAVSRC